MNKNVNKKLLEKDFILLDGAMGTMLQNAGLKLGERPEILNITNPELIKSIHEKYLLAGSNIIYANTFCANSHKLAGFEYSVAQVVSAGVKNAKEVADKFGGLVALDVGPIGELLEPSGTLKFEDAYEIYKEILVAGEKAGADIVVFETMTDLYEVKAGVLSAKENTNLPVFVSMTFEENGRTFTGVGIENMAVTLEGLGVYAMGINCSLGPIEILPLAKQLATLTSLPLIIKPNAGLPNPETGEYNLLAEDFGIAMKEYAKIGVTFLGGCCGTTPEYIAQIKKNLQNKTKGERTFTQKTKVCSQSKVVTVDSVKIIGERVNPTGKKRFQTAIKQMDMPYILSQALAQTEVGADILDVNVGVPETDEAGTIKAVVKGIQSVTNVPLQIDSSKLEAIEAGLRYYNGKPILNSTNGEEEKMHQIFPLVKKYGACVVCLTIDEEGIPKTAEKRVQIAKNILKTAEKYGIAKHDIIIDCLALTISAQQKDCQETLKAMRIIKEELGLNMTLGVSNISFGLPNRNLVNHSFLTLAMGAGLTLPIINPNSQDMINAVKAYNALSGTDENCEDFIATFCGENAEKQNAIAVKSQKTLSDAVMLGLEYEAEQLTKQQLETSSPNEIINDILIPTLDIVGKKYEKGEYFLPQLIKSANASCKAFEVIKTQIAKTNSESISRGKIILATVKGDIHDIGKNIVKVILENYGYQVIDLGKDVPKELIVETAIKEDAKLIGLSALMTTTVVSMKEAIEALKQSGHDCKIMVGGAVLTKEHACKINADFYVKDAKQSVDIAKGVFKN
ncbi:MAG: homocysteine S-methyltransferase family protein [Bacillota bacterium]